MNKKVMAALLCLCMLVVMIPTMLIVATSGQAPVPAAATPQDDVTVFFKPGYGYPDLIRTIPVGSTVARPADPEAPEGENVVFSHWAFLDYNGSYTIWKFSDPVNSDLILVARWLSWPIYNLEATVDWAPFADAVLTARSRSNSTESYEFTNKGDGQYSIQLPAGLYDLEVHGQRFRSVTLANGTTSHTSVNFSKITFDANGQDLVEGTLPSPQYRTSVMPATMPPAPEALDPACVFTRWTTGPEATAPTFNFNLPPTSSQTLYAQWTEIGENQYPVLVNGADLEGSPVATHGLAYTGKLLPQTHFALPSDDAQVKVDGTSLQIGTEYIYNNDTGELEIFDEHVTGPILITVQMKRMYTVHFDANGGTDTMETVVTPTANGYPLPEPEFTAPDDKPYFGGWRLNNPLTGSLYYVGNKVFALQTEQTFYATWNIGIDWVHVHFTDNNKIDGGTTRNNFVSAEVSQRESLPPDAGKVSWSISENTSPDTFISQQGDLTVGWDEKSRNIKIRATSDYDPTVWGEATADVNNTYKLTVNSGTGSGQYFFFRDLFYIDPDPAPAGQIFDKWVLESGGVTLAAVPSVPNRYSARINRQDVVVTATYANLYRVVFDTAGGTPIPDFQIIRQDGKVALPAADPEKFGFTFDGWYREAEGTNPWDFDNDLVTGDLTLYAKWTPEALDGFVSLTGSAVFGEALTVDTSAITNNTGTLLYLWQRGGSTIDGATGTAYTLAEADIGQIISCMVTSDVQTGSLIAMKNTPVAKAAGPPVTGVSKTDCTTLANNDASLLGVTGAMEYKELTDTIWQDGTGSDLTGLTDGIYQVRVKETATHAAGEISYFVIAPYQPLYIPLTLTDPQTGISVSGSIREDAQLVVTDAVPHEPGECAACDAIRKRAENTAYTLLLHKDISLSEGFKGELTVSIPLDPLYNGKKVAILHCAKGTLKTYTAIVQGGLATFRVTELSPFAAFGGAGGQGIPATGAHFLYPGLGLLAVGMAGALILILRRRELRA